MTKALVIKTVGDPAIAGAIVNGMTKQVIPIDNAELSALKADLARMRARSELRAYGDQKRLGAARRELARKYSSEPHGRAYNAILGVYGLLCLVVASAYDKLSAWNRS